MIQEFFFNGEKVVFDTERLPPEHTIAVGVKAVHPCLSYELRQKAYAEIRETAAGLLDTNSQPNDR